MVRRFPRERAPGRAGLCPAGDPRRDGVERFIGAGAVGASGLGEIGAAAPAFAAERFGADATSSTALKVGGEVVGHADDEAGLALIAHADDGDDARAQVGACRHRRAPRRSFGATPCTRAGEELDRPISRGRTAAVSPPHRRQAQARAWRRRTASRACGARRGAASRSIISSGRPSAVAACLAHAGILRGEIRARGLAGQRLDAAHAGGDRAFADDLEQADIAGAAHMGAAAELDRIGAAALASPVRLPMLTTRTSSPYFSPNSAIAPLLIASSGAIRWVSTGGVLQNHGVGQVLDLADLVASSASYVEKSKRSRSGATSEPFCATCLPSTSRSASCSRCVAEWIGARVGVRRSTSSSTASPT